MTSVMIIGAPLLPGSFRVGPRRVADLTYFHRSTDESDQKLRIMGVACLIQRMISTLSNPCERVNPPIAEAGFRAL
jgi:hypothetical protein